MNKVKVGGVDYTVRELSELIHDGIEVFGLCKTEEGEIQILKRLGKPYKRHTLLHEIIHAIMINYSLNLEDDELTERVVDCLAAGFLALLRDNPSLVSYLTNKDKASASASASNKGVKK